MFLGASDLQTLTHNVGMSDFCGFPMAGYAHSVHASVCNLNTKEHKSKSAAITQTGNRVQNLAGVRNETKSSESKFGKAQVSIC